MTPEPIACCVCGETRALPWRTAGDNLLGGEETFQAVRCIRCGTRRLDPRPAPAAMSRYYAPQTYARAEDGETEVGKRLDAYAAGVADRVSSLLPRPSSLLDVGGGDGRFLSAMAVRGWQVTGTETDPVAAGLARRRVLPWGGAVHEGTLDSLPLPLETFGLVSLLHVLEHVPNPRQTLKQCHDLLRPSGGLLLALPNAGSAEAALFGSGWYHLDLPRHYWGFTPHGLGRLAEETGFTVVSLRHFPLLFAPQSVRNLAARLRRRGGNAGDSPARGSGGGRWQTRAFVSLLGLSERLGRTLPGEVMEMVAFKNE